MAILDTINVGGADFKIRDTEARELATNAMNRADEVEAEDRQHRQNAAAFFWDRQEDKADNTYIKSYPSGSLFVWKSFNLSTQDASWYPSGMFMKTTCPVTAGTLIHPGINCIVCTMEDMLNSISTYVASDGKLHFKNYRGADSVLNFNNKKGYTSAVLRNVGDQLRFDLYDVRANSNIVFSSTNNQPCDIILKDGNGNLITTLYGFITGYNYVFTSNYDVVCVYLEKTANSETDNFWCWWEFR